MSLWLQTDATVPDDKAYFRELEAIYVLRLLLTHCSSSLESCAYELQDASAVLTAKLQSTPLFSSPCLVHKPMCNAEPCILCTDSCSPLYVTAALEAGLTHFHALPIQERELSSCRWCV